MERTLSSKRSGAGAGAAAALVPSGMTERQMLAMALEESRRAAMAAKHTAMQEDEGSSSDESSSDDESSAGGARARGNIKPQQQQQRGAGESKPAKRRRPRPRPGLLHANAKETGKAPATPRKRARVEPTEFRTATSSENSKASRTTQQLLDLGGSLRGSLEGSLTAADAAAVGQRRGDSADSEHNSISGGSGQNTSEPGKPKQEASSEGAGESGGCAEQQQQQQQRSSAAPDQESPAGQLDAQTIAEMARKRRERFGTSCDAAAAAPHKPKPLRRAPSCAAPQQQKSQQLEVIARSRSSLAALVESDLFPDTPRRGGAASKTATPAVTPTLASVEAAARDARDAGAREAAEEQKVSLCGNAAAAAVGTESAASPVRTPSPVAGSPRSLQGSEVQGPDLAADISQKLGEVKREDAEDTRQETGPQDGACPVAPKQPKRRKPGPVPKQGRVRDSPDLAMLDPLVKAEGGPCQTPRKGRVSGGANRGARSVSRTPSRNSRWASSHLASPSGGLGRRLRSAVVEEFKHNTDASDPFAWQPQTPSRARASALLAACAVLAAQDKQLSASEPSPSPREAPESCPTKQQQQQQQRQQEQMDAVRDYAQQQATPVLKSDCQPADFAPPPAQPSAVQAVQASAPPAEACCQQRLDQAQAKASPNEASAMEVELELSAEPSTPPGTPKAVATALEAFTTPAHQMLRDSSVEFPALEANGSAAATPVLCTPALTPVVKWRPPLWKKLHPLCLDLQAPADQAEQSCSREAPSVAATPAPARQLAFSSALPSPARAQVADAAAQVCAAFRGRHGLEGRRLEMSSSCVADEPGVWKPEASAAAHTAAPFQGSRLGKALAACYGSRRRGDIAAAGFRGGCAGLRAPYARARNAPAWRSASMSRSGSAGSSCGLGVNPHLARQRTQRNLQNTWDDLLARQALEACTAEALAAWAQPDQASA